MTAPPTPVADSLDRLAGVFGQRINAALPLMWARRMSMHDARGNVHWQSTDVWSPAERDAVRLALERFVGSSAPSRADQELPEQRTAVLLRAADRNNTFRGFVMMVVDNRRLRGKGQSVLDLPVPVQRAVAEWAVRLASASHVRPSGPRPEPELTDTQVQKILAGQAIEAAQGAPADLAAPLERAPVESLPVEEPALDDYLAKLREFAVELVAQPLTPLQQGLRIRRFEVLLREGNGSNAGDGAPVHLLRGAEERGLGAVIDRRVFAALLGALAAQGAAFSDRPAQFSLNISASSLRDPNLPRFLELCIARAGARAELLAFEIDQALWRPERARIERLGEVLNALGAGLVIDNCTLHEETAELLGIPGVRLAKIDRRLTQDLAASRVAQMRVAGLAQIGRVAGVHVVAKQVELAAEQELLRALGVDFLQGFATATPQPLEELVLRLSSEDLVDENVREEFSALAASDATDPATASEAGETGLARSEAV
jgi:EAL domain-containing protein (putative c-di-GMP-specific phosphodiesterase class I)